MTITRARQPQKRGNFHAVEGRALVMQSDHTLTQRERLTMLSALRLCFWALFYVLVSFPVPTFDLGASKTLLTSSGINPRVLPSGNPRKFGSSEWHLETKYQTDDSLKNYTLYFISINRFFSSKFLSAYRLPSRTVFILSPGQNQSVVGAVSCTRSCKMGDPSTLAVTPLRNFRFGTTTSRWTTSSAHLDAIPGPIERHANASRWPSNRVFLRVVYPGCPKGTKFSTLRRLAGYCASCWTRSLGSIVWCGQGT